MALAGPRRILIVGGVAGGATCATRLRRLDEDAEIHIFERGPYVAYANCGLPYHIGNVITDENKLIVATSALFRSRFNVEVHTRHEVEAIDRSARHLRVRDLESGGVREERYDVLVLAPGAAPIRPAIPGLDTPGVFTLRSIPDTRAIRAWIAERKARSAVVAGGGFIGLELTENLSRLGLEVTLVSRSLLGSFDAEMTAPLRKRLAEHKVNVILGELPAAFAATPEGVALTTSSGRSVAASMALVALGVAPETALARGAGLTIGPRGGILVNDRMATVDPHIWAVGDAVEVRDVVTGQDGILPLAGPAQRQARIAAEAICGRASRFRGVQATAVIGAFGLTAASTGASERALRRSGITSFRAVYLHPGHHAGYYPGAKTIHMKLLFTIPDGRILGAQAIGEEGVEKRIDVIATHIQHGGTVRDLAESELCYAPQFGAAKDPVNLAGMMACNHIDGDLPLGDWEQVSTVAERGGLVVDVREEGEFKQGSMPGALNAPLSSLRTGLSRLPRDKELWLLCSVGQRSYYAARLLSLRGYRVRHLSGGLTTFEHRRGSER